MLYSCRGDATGGRGGYGPVPGGNKNHAEEVKRPPRRLTSFRLQSSCMQPELFVRRDGFLFRSHGKLPNLIWNTASRDM